MSYKNLEVWKIARELSIQAHEMSLTLPRFELFEEGSQIRRSSKSVRINIVEGYGRRRYKGEFVKFLTYAHASNDETVDHLETLWETHSLGDEKVYQRIRTLADLLGRMLNLFIRSVDKAHNQF